MAMEFKMDITDGKGRRFNSPADALASGIREELDNALTTAERAARQQVCPVHHQHPSVERRRVRGKYELQIEACCDDAVDRAETAASRALR